MDQEQDGSLAPSELAKQREITRSLIYRAMSRAQFFLVVLNHQFRNGFFSFFNKVVLVLSSVILTSSRTRI